MGVVVRGSSVPLGQWRSNLVSPAALRGIGRALGLTRLQGPQKREPGCIRVTGASEVGCTGTPLTYPEVSGSHPPSLWGMICPLLGGE